jgi:hypothetical protein
MNAGFDVTWIISSAAVLELDMMLRRKLKIDGLR